MKRFVSDFVRRGLIACGIGPIVLAVVYLILQHFAVIEELTVEQVCMGIFSLSALAFIAGGMNALYQIERLPIMLAILIHGSVLYVAYLVTYLVNDWLERSMKPIIIFSIIFVVLYLMIWTVIYLTTIKNTEKINEVLKKKQGHT